MPIFIEQLTHTYMPGSILQTQAIHDITLTVEDGEFLGVIGHTGSGKSTLIQHLNGLLLPTSGRVRVNEFDIADKKSRMEIRKQVGIVFQYPEYQLFEETVFKDVAFGPHNMKLTEDEVNARVIEALELVELDVDEAREKSPFELSGGQKRRVALAGIIAMKPKYLVLDEPMAGLDPRGHHILLRLIRKLRETTGCSIVMVSHSMDDVARLADRIAVLNEGELCMLGTPYEVFTHSDELVAMGLDVPQATRLAIELRRRGIPVPRGIYNMRQIEDYIKEHLAHV